MPSEAKQLPPTLSVLLLGEKESYRALGEDASQDFQIPKGNAPRFASAQSMLGVTEAGMGVKSTGFEASLIWCLSFLCHLLLV